MLPALPHPHQVESSIPRTSPIAQPVRQCRVAVTAIRQLASMSATLPPGGIWVQPRSHAPAGPPAPDRRFNDPGELPPPARPDHPRRPHPAQPRGHGLDAHRASRTGSVTSRLWRRTSPSARAAGSGLIITGGFAPDRRGWLKPFAARHDHASPGDATPRGDRRRPRGRRRDRAAGAACGPLRLPPVQRQRVARPVADHAVPAVGAQHARASTGPRATSPGRRGWPGRRGTTPSRSWAPRAT